MKYFNTCSTIEEAKKLYRNLAFQYHPDRGGNDETMKEINSEYDFICAKILAGEDLTTEERAERMGFDERYRQIIEKITPIEGIVIEVIGSWIWVSGSTYVVRKDLHEAGLFFAPKKKMWYWRPEDQKVARGGNKSIEEIRAKYGSEYINNSNNGNRTLS